MIEGRCITCGRGLASEGCSQFTCPECGSKKLLNTRLRRPEETNDPKIKEWLQEQWGQKEDDPRRDHIDRSAGHLPEL